MISGGQVGSSFGGAGEGEGDGGCEEKDDEVVVVVVGGRCGVRKAGLGSFEGVGDGWAVVG